MKLIKINTDHYVVVDDSEIKYKDWYIDDTNQVRMCVVLDTDYWKSRKEYKKITHSTQPLSEKCKTCTGYCEQCVDGTKSLSLQEVKELIGEVDVEKKAAQNSDTYQKELGYIKGYNQALEDNKEKKYTEEDMRKAYMVGKHGGVTQTYYEFDEYIQQLQPKTEWDVEIVDGKLKLIELVRGTQ